MNIPQKIAEELSVNVWQIEAAVRLIDEGCTIPFIARYRKEAHGSMNDEQLRTLDERLSYLRGLEERKAHVIAVINEQDKMTPELMQLIDAAETLVVLEDLYRPYKPKRRTRAAVAREKGLEPFASLILAQNIREPIEQAALAYVSSEKGVDDPQAAIAGAADIIAEQIADDADIRSWIRKRTFAYGRWTSKAKDAKAESVYETYYDFESPVEKMTGHRVLAMNRGEKERFLTVKLEAPEEDILHYLERRVLKNDNPITSPVIKNAAADAYRRLIAPSIENEIRAELTENAEDGAIAVFGKNLRQLLMQPPIVGATVLGWDPAFRTGCKLAVVDPTGKVLDTAVIYPTAPTNERKIAEAKAKCKELIKKYDVTLISLGNGTASRESEQIITEMLKENHSPVHYVITSEAGASVYSASALATEEFPEFDVGQRSAASIARRVQDPLAELVKIDPKAIGIGQYQHDMNQKKLGSALAGTVEDCVNSVGVDLNTASVPLLTYVSGISKTLAKNIVEYREANGSFKDRKELRNVPKLGPKAFEQCAGFLRIRNGSNPLDGTAVHPESYGAAEKLISASGQKTEDLRSGAVVIRISDYKRKAEELGIGEPTLRDIVSELSRPGRDPREDMPKPVLRSDVLDMKDLKEGMILKGTVRNIVDFGAFVDIGVHQDGMVHVSKLTNKKFVRHPLEVVSVGDIVEVRVIAVDVKKKRISLSMIL